MAKNGERTNQDPIYQDFDYKKLRALMEHSTDAIVLINKTGKVLFSSPSIKNVLGYTPEEFTGTIGFNFVHSKDLPPVMKNMSKLLIKKGKTVTSVVRVKHKSGKWVWIEATGTNLLFDKFLHAIVVNFRDISALKQADEYQEFLGKLTNTLMANLDHQITLEEIGKLIVSYLADYCRIVIVNEQGEIQEIAINHTNPKKAKIVQDLFDSYKDRPDNTHGIPHILQTGKSEIISEVNEKIYLSVKNNPQLFKNLKDLGLKSYMGVPMRARGKVIGAITFSSVQDHRFYTQRDLKVAETVAHRTALMLDNVKLFQEAKQSASTLKFLAEAGRLLSSSLDYQTTLNSIAQLAVARIADWCAVDMLGNDRTLHLVAIAHKDPKQVKWAKELRKQQPTDMDAKTGVPNVIRTGKSEIYPLITDDMLVAITKNKRELQLARSLGMTSAMVVPLCREGKCLGGITFISTKPDRLYGTADLEIAEELASRASLAIDNAWLYKGSQEAITLRDDFISVASHELKTPVTSVKMFTQVLKKHSQQIGDEKAVSHLSKMDKQLNKLTELIYDLLNISKIQAGKMEFREELFDFDKVIHEVVDVLQQTATKHTIGIQGATKKKVRGDEERIGQVLNNLVSNAIKYSPKADKVLVKLDTDTQNVYVTVQDFGIGMAQEHLGRIFERFYRVYDTTDKTFPGLGIGLYISSEIVKRHGGKLWVDSDVGKGSIFHFSLPINGKQKHKTN